MRICNPKAGNCSRVDQVSCCAAAEPFFPMNIHHLELFYYVAKHEGISNAVRKIPYGIPATGGQCADCAARGALDATLFHRRPFELTETGQTLYEFVEPFFSKLNKMADDLRGGGKRSGSALARRTSS
ncbi:MAG: hypothetical protein CM1200mP29_11670 [Verrucomicrobiota bacterium]|nr:MAG: hypothetical protein CM1200mP29_11670 [Verrucomicrobiota bacterium]